MGKFDLQSYLDNVYSRFPEAEYQPVIGITGNYEDNICKLSHGYFQSVVAAGGVPMIIPPVEEANTLVNTLDRIDALILSGGGDINPLFGGDEPSPRLRGINQKRDLPELMITRLAYNRQIPILGICRGIQALAVALGGKVAQDISIQANVKHSQDADRAEQTHSIKIAEDSILHSLYGEEKIYVNSFHHQAVKDAGDKFRVVAKSSDGIIEAMESSEYKSIIGVQWHPECLEDGMPLFRWLVEEAKAFRRANELHDRVLTLDTHCDTPMFFPQGIHFDHRDSKILVDLHKMNEGRQDATIMVAYLPQPKIGETFSSLVDFDVPGPLEYADLIFDKIEEITEANRKYISIARTPGDLYEDKRNGRKSIMLGIENGIALNGQLQNLQHFVQRGVVYITLCHNGDNDICDSARGCNTHGGVSRFGEQVIREMNRLGIMVDMSHAAEKSFYDALEISSMPIVCSHSSSRALCDHPRNLTDDQMRALAAKGGVAQTTLYSGFLKKEGEATIIDAIEHLEHAIKIMGIDHVGLGTDFDGDGGVKGLADSSELINFTRQLLARRYSERDIQKIWGGNFLRVMGQVQKVRG
jgi:microsomal dipeptidase-like Zn-dependent dipeptidase/gamma-glutamyl-gamma-aminobutyrate hydrolase PuuD